MVDTAVKDSETQARHGAPPDLGGCQPWVGKSGEASSATKNCRQPDTAGHWERNQLRVTVRRVIEELIEETVKSNKTAAGVDEFVGKFWTKLTPALEHCFGRHSGCGEHCPYKAVNQKAATTIDLSVTCAACEDAIMAGLRDFFPNEVLRKIVGEGVGNPGTNRNEAVHRVYWATRPKGKKCSAMMFDIGMCLAAAKQNALTLYRLQRKPVLNRLTQIDPALPEEARKKAKKKVKKAADDIIPKFQLERRFLSLLANEIGTDPDALALNPNAVRVAKKGLQKRTKRSEYGLDPEKKKARRERRRLARQEPIKRPAPEMVVYAGDSAAAAALQRGTASKRRKGTSGKRNTGQISGQAAFSEIRQLQEQHKKDGIPQEVHDPNTKTRIDLSNAAADQQRQAHSIILKWVADNIRS